MKCSWWVIPHQLNKEEAKQAASLSLFSSTSVLYFLSLMLPLSCVVFTACRGGGGGHFHLHSVSYGTYLRRKPGNFMVRGSFNVLVLTEKAIF